MNRELVMLGTASQVPTRDRNHVGALLRWDAEGILFDPGEGTQRQLTHAGLAVSSVTRICVTHFHGDHCLGVPGVLQRMAVDGVRHPVHAYFPAEGAELWERLRRSTVSADGVDLTAHACRAGVVHDGPALRVLARPLDHRTPTLGWRLEEPDGRRIVPERLAQRGLSGPIVGRLQREGAVELGGTNVRLEEVSVPRPGQKVAWVMDTAVCDAAYELAEGVDLLVCEATYLDADRDLAARYKHLTARQAATIAAEAGARRLVLTHFSRRYPDLDDFAREAGAFHDDVVVPRDLDRVAVPSRAP